MTIVNTIVMDTQTGRERGTTMSQYRTVSTHTLAGLKQAERLKASGWKIIASGLYRIVFEKARPATKARRN